MQKLRVLDLFSGIGGFSLGLERTGGFETVAFCEIEEFPRRVLAKHWPEIYCHDDVRTLTKETLCKGFAQNALLNQLCKETGGNIACAKDVITNIKKNAAKQIHHTTTIGPQNVEEALSIIMAGNVPVAESQNTHFWQLTTSLITEILREKSTKALCGKLLSVADFRTITKFFVTTAIWQKHFTEHALTRTIESLGYNDVRTLTAGILARDGITVDVITGGFPCQDISVAGNQAGISSGTRSGLWSEIARLTRELRPLFVIVENVTNLLRGPTQKPGAWFGRVLGDLAKCGYDAEWYDIPASFIGAWHRRGRVWLLAYPNEVGRQQRGTPQPILRQCHVQKQSSRSFANWPGRSNLPESRLCGRNNGVPDVPHRLAALGNAVVPQIPELIGRAILQSKIN